MKTEPTEALKEIKRCTWTAEDFNVSDGFESHEVVDKNDAINIANIAFNEAMRWRDPKEELPDWDMQVLIKGGILKPEIGLDFENIHCTGYYCDGAWYAAPTDYSSIEIGNPTGWRPIE